MISVQIIRDWLIVALGLAVIYLIAPSDAPTIKIADRICVAGRC